MVNIRLLKPEDWQGLFDLIEPVDKTLVGMCSKTEELVEDWINTIVEGIWEVYVAILPQEEIKKAQSRLMRKIFLWKRKRDIPSGIIGIVTLYGDSSEDEDILPGEFDIGITVDESFQKRGIGKQLLSFIIARGKEVKYERATLWTRIDNQPMIKLARKMGFQKGKKRQRDGFTWHQYFLDVKEKEKKEEEISS